MTDSETQTANKLIETLKAFRAESREYRSEAKSDFKEFRSETNSKFQALESKQDKALELVNDLRVEVAALKESSNGLKTSVADVKKGSDRIFVTVVASAIVATLGIGVGRVEGGY